MSATPWFIEFVVDGPPGWTLGHVQGFLHGQGVSAAIYDAEAEGFDVATLREKLLDRILPGATTQHVLVPAAALPAARAALDDAADRLSVRAERRWNSAGFRFSFRVYSREHAARIRSFFEPLPAGIRAGADLRIEEIVRTGAEGIEMLTPSHAWELRGSGTVEGEIDAVVGLLRRCRAEELVEVRGARLVDTGATGESASA